MELYGRNILLAISIQHSVITHQSFDNVSKIFDTCDCSTVPCALWRNELIQLKMRGLTSLLWGFVALYVVNGVQSELTPEPTSTTDTTETVTAYEYENGPENYTGPPEDYTGSPEDYTDPPPFEWPNFENQTANASSAMYLDTAENNMELWLTDTRLFKKTTPIYSIVSGASNSSPIITKYSTVWDTVKGSKNLEKGVVRLSNRRSNDSQGVDASPDEETNAKITANNTFSQLSPPAIEDPEEQWIYYLWDRERRRQCSEHHRDCVDHCGDLSVITENESPECATCRQMAQDIFPECPLRSKTMYPRILIVVDYSYYEKFNKSDSDIVTYLLGFWNGVDLRFRFFENPKVRLNIVGVVLAKDADALRYMKSETDESVDIEMSVNEAGLYWYEQTSDIPYDSYDLAVTMTLHSLCDYGWSEVVNRTMCRVFSQGISLTFGVCATTSAYLPKVATVADNAGFQGIRTAAHELGHAFGMQHDGNVENERCSARDGYVMAPNKHMSAHDKLWSNCSLENFQIFLDSHPFCFSETMDKKDVLPVYLPGKMMDTQEQCDAQNGLQGCSIDPSSCQHLNCKHPLFPRCLPSFYAAADGSACDTGKICLNGQCAADPTVAALTGGQ
ncbi:uncharacterized protein LOC135169874 [Diachasmimorpha longicaudata]|uniref:uncharacterized protein LOC135169874 n=1 Tax=Diachasmimorpha longicaudata TaxID=58733 RepID=UPI0030B8ACDA